MATIRPMPPFVDGASASPHRRVHSIADMLLLRESLWAVRITPAPSPVRFGIHALRAGAVDSWRLSLSRLVGSVLVYSLF